MRISLIIVSGVLMCSLLACEDVIDPKLEQADAVLNIDAWITDKPGDQVIYINTSVPYDDNDALPPAVSGARVSVTDSRGKTYDFKEDASRPGEYIWSSEGKPFGEIGLSFELKVEYNGQVFRALSAMLSVPQIDSITSEYSEETRGPISVKGYRAEFWARDLPGTGNTYWIRTRKNGVLLNKPAEINLSFDGSVSAGSANDGGIFITPIRLGINPDEVDQNDDPIAPYNKGDSIHVEIHSITIEAFNYLNEVSQNTDRQTGFASLFSTSLTNVSTNINSNASVKSPVVGFFSVSAVSRASHKVE